MRGRGKAGRGATNSNFSRTQRNWAIAGLIVWLTIPLLVGGMVFGIFGAMKKSDAYAMSMAEITQNQAVQAALGENIAAGFFVSGSIHLNGAEGNAVLQIPLHGSRANGVGYSRAQKVAGAWQITLLVVRIDGSSEPIVLINRDNLPIPGGPLDT